MKTAGLYFMLHVLLNIALKSVYFYTVLVLRNCTYTVFFLFMILRFPVVAQNELKFITTAETRSLNLAQFPIHLKIGIPSLNPNGHIIWNFLSLESDKSISTAVGLGAGFMGKGVNISKTMYLLAEYQVRYLSPSYQENYPTLTHLSKIGMGYRFARPVSMTCMLGFDNNWAIFVDFGILTQISYKPKPTRRCQIKCPK